MGSEMCIRDRRRRRKRTHIYRSLRSLHLLYGHWAALLGTRLSIGEASKLYHITETVMDQDT